MTLDYVKGGTVQKGEDGLAGNGHSYERENWKWNLTARMITTGKNSRKKKNSGVYLHEVRWAKISEMEHKKH